MSEVYVALVFDVQNGNARISKESLEIFNQMVEHDPVTLLDLINDSMTALNEYHDKAYYQVYPRFKPDSNVSDFPKKDF